MYVFHQQRDEAAFEIVQTAGLDLMLAAPLAGLTLAGQSIHITEDARIDPPTMNTDGKMLRYHPDWPKKKGIRSITFDLLHEWLHIFGNHPLRCRDRDRKLWNWCCDVRVAHDALHILNHTGTWKLDSDHVPAYAWATEMSVEEIYASMLTNSSYDPRKTDRYKKYTPDLDYDGANTKPPEEREEFLYTFTEELAQATFAEERLNIDMPKRYGESLFQRLQELRRSRADWTRILPGRLVAGLGSKSPSYTRPNRKWFPEIFLPSLRDKIEPSLLLAIDVSGSLTDELIRLCRGAIMPAARRAKKTTIITFDQTIREEVTARNPAKLLAELKMTTGYHSCTDVRPVFARVDALRPASLAVITDGRLIYPDKPYPKTNWLILPGGTPPPWGRIYAMETTW